MASDEQTVEQLIDLLVSKLREAEPDIGPIEWRRFRQGAHAMAEACLLVADLEEDGGSDGK